MYVTTIKSTKVIQLPMETRWYDDSHQIAYQRIYGRWSVKDVLEGLNTAAQELKLDEDNVPPYFIVDMRDAVGVPTGILSARSDYEHHIKDGDILTVTIGANRLVRILTETLRRMGLDYNVCFADNEEEALAIIRAYQQANARD